MFLNKINLNIPLEDEHLFAKPRIKFLKERCANTLIFNNFLGGKKTKKILTFCAHLLAFFKDWASATPLITDNCSFYMWKSIVITYFLLSCFILNMVIVPSEQESMIQSECQKYTKNILYRQQVKHFSYLGIIKCYKCSNVAVHNVMRVFRKQPQY